MQNTIIPGIRKMIQENTAGTFCFSFAPVAFISHLIYGFRDINAQSADRCISLAKPDGKYGYAAIINSYHTLAAIDKKAPGDNDFNGEFMGSSPPGIQAALKKKFSKVVTALPDGVTPC